MSTTNTDHILDPDLAAGIDAAVRAACTTLDDQRRDIARLEADRRALLDIVGEAIVMTRGVGATAEMREWSLAAQDELANVLKAGR